MVFVFNGNYPISGSDEMDRNAKLAAARKKLNQFKRKKGQRNDIGVKPESDTSDRSTPEIVLNHDRDIKTSEEFIDEKFEMLHCAESEDNLLSSTAATTESILQVSAKLNGLAAEAEVFIDGDVSMPNENSYHQNISADGSIHESNNSVHNLETRNQELAAKVSSLTMENQNLLGQCQQLTDRTHHLQAMIEEQNESLEEKIDEGALREQLQVQMQTIGVLVSEKQDLQQELITIKSDLKSSRSLQKKMNEDMQAVKEQLVSMERESNTKADSLSLHEKRNSELQNEYEACKQAFERTKFALDSEQVQVSELTDKLQRREMEYRELCLSHTDLREKLDMADVLLQQMSTNGAGDTNSQLTRLQQEKESLTAKLTEYHQAFEQLSAEREQLSRQFADTQRQWETEIQTLQSMVQSLQSEKEGLANELRDLRESPSHNLPDETKTEPISNAVRGEDSGEIERLQQMLNEAGKTRNVLQEEIVALQGNNQYLSKLVQEKETRIYEIENDLDQVKASISKQEQLLDGARSDKVTISRALLQNKQLKEQLQEIQEGFVRMSNDKMDLATQVSSLEHGNRDLQACLNQNSALYQQTKQQLETLKEESIRLQQQNFNLQAQTNNVRVQNEDESDVMNIMRLKLDAAEQSLARANAENAELQQKLTLLPNGDATVDATSLSPMCEQQFENDVMQNGESSNKTSAEDTSVIEDANHVKNYTVKVEDGLATELPASAVEHEASERLQCSMALLQDKFMSVMREKADLLNKLELMEHTNTQLQNECDTIGEYIALYHNQRQILKQRHREKDEYISTIIHEREAMQGKVEQLQTLIMAMLNNRQGIDVGSVTSSPQRHVVLESDFGTHGNEASFDETGSETLQRQTLLSEQPDLVPKTEVSFTDEADTSDSHVVIPGYSRKVHTSSESSTSERDHAAAAQILTLLEQIQKPIDPSISNKNSIPSGFCMRYIGPYTAI